MNFPPNETTPFNVMFSVAISFSYMWHIQYIFLSRSAVHEHTAAEKPQPKNTQHYLFSPFGLKCYVYVLFNICLFPPFHLLCCSHQELHTEAGFNDPVLLRRKRMAQVEKNTCQLFIQTDHLFYKYYKTREAVIAQVIHVYHDSLDTQATVVL